MKDAPPEDDTDRTLNGRLHTDLRPEEERWLESACGEDLTPQQLTRALYLLASEDEEIADRAREVARKGRRLGTGRKRRRGILDEDDVREAIGEEGSLSGAARVLGAHRSSIRYVCAERGIYVPSMGRVPEQFEKYK
jgi:hypothetical protein